MLEPFPARQSDFTALQARDIGLAKRLVAVVRNALRQFLLAPTELLAAGADRIPKRALHLQFVHRHLLVTGAGHRQ